MKIDRNHVSVCICTYRRPALLERLLGELDEQAKESAVSFSIIVADNDASRTAEETVRRYEKNGRVKVTYCVEPTQNIAMARNRAIDNSGGEFVAFIDDDEFPAVGWLDRALEACRQYGVAGILGPVRPHFESRPPDWILEGGFCKRPEYCTGRIMGWEESRSGNLLFRREILREGEDAFDAAFGNGGEDKDFFMRMTEKGWKFRWCNEAIVYETVPPERWGRKYMLRRALLRGKNILKHPKGKMRMLATSCVAVPIYSIILLPMLIAGEHYFMKYCIKLCDHLGRLLALVSMNPINER